MQRANYTFVARVALCSSNKSYKKQAWKFWKWRFFPLAGREAEAQRNRLLAVSHESLVLTHFLPQELRIQAGITRRKWAEAWGRKGGMKRQ